MGGGHVDPSREAFAAFRDLPLIGPGEERWDVGFVAAYPSGAAFLEMLADPDYRAAVVNRTAAVLDSRLVRFAPGEGGPGFG